jgi:hypothetical protein
MNMQLVYPAAQSAAPASADFLKRLATLKARCALDGVVLNPIENDRGRTLYIVTKSSTTRELTSLGAVEQWLGHAAMELTGVATP